MNLATTPYASSPNGVETRHAYNARNQLIRTEENETVSEYSYDKRGNLTQIMENGNIKANFVFDAANRMVQAHTSKGHAEYTYNGFLKRVKRLEGMNDTRYVHDLTKPYNDLLSIGNQTFIWGNDLLMAEGGNNFSYLHDHLGSPIRLVGETQEQPLAYDEFDVPTVEANNGSSNLNNPFGFTGYQFDDVSGLYFAQARYYGANSGRFVSEDPIKDMRNWYLIKGLWQGISNAADWIWGKIKGFFGGIVDGIKSFFGIRSPSKLFAGLGENMAQGLGLGFEEQMNQVARDMKNAIPSSFDTDINANAHLTGNGGVPGSGGNGTVIHQSISVTTPKALSERELAREFKNLSRKLALEV